MDNKLELLKKQSTIVADTGDIEAIQRYKPQDATTNPSLLLKAAQIPEYKVFIKDAICWSKSQSKEPLQQLDDAMDKLAVTIGVEILQMIPGRISTEVDARLSYDSKATVTKARKLIRLYEEVGIGKERVLIKIAATWEGIRAAEQLEREGINCNLTLLFSFTQAQACADAGVYLISPFVGRILDWYKDRTGQESYSPAEDPGVVSVKEIFNYYKRHSYNTIVMGASFRNSGEILELAGCDRLTIAPQLLEELANTQGEVTRKLEPYQSVQDRPKAIDEKTFRWEMNQNAMATEKLAEGIRNFAADQAKLEELLSGFYD